MASKWGDSASPFSTFSFRLTTPMHLCPLLLGGKVKKRWAIFSLCQLHDDDDDDDLKNAQRKQSQIVKAGLEILLVCFGS